MVQGAAKGFSLKVLRLIIIPLRPIVLKNNVFGQVSRSLDLRLHTSGQLSRKSDIFVKVSRF